MPSITEYTKDLPVSAGGRPNYTNPQGYNVPSFGDLEAKKKKKNVDGFFNHVGDIAKGIVNSPVAFVDSTVEFLGDTVEWAGRMTKQVDADYETGWGVDFRFFDDLGTAGQISERIAEFGIGMVLTQGLSSLSIIKNGGRLAKMGAEVARGGLVNMVVSEQEEGLLSDMLAETPIGARIPLLQFMRGDIAETDMEWRMKALVEGGVLDVMTMGAMKGLGKVLKAHIGVKHAGDTIAQDVLAKQLTGTTGDTTVRNMKRSSAQVIGDMPSTNMSTGSKPIDPANTIASKFFVPIPDESKVLREALLKNDPQVIDDYLKSFLDNYDDVLEGLSAFETKHFHKMNGFTENMEGVENILQAVAKMEDMYNGKVQKGWELTKLDAQIDIARGRTGAKAAAKDIASAERSDTLVHKWKLLRDDSAEDVWNLLDDFSTANIDTPEGLQKALDIAYVLEGHIEIHRTSQRVSSGVARGNRANAIPTYRIAVDGEKITTQGLNLKTISKIQKDPALQLSTKARLKNTEALINNIKKAGSVTKALESAMDTKEGRSALLQGLDLLHAWRVSSMLSSPSTHLRNTVGSGLTFVMTNIIEPSIAATGGYLRGDADRLTFKAVGAGIAEFHQGSMDFFKNLNQNIQANGGWGAMLSSMEKRQAALGKSKLVRRDDFAKNVTVNAESLTEMGFNMDAPLGKVIAPVFNFFGNVQDMASMTAMGFTDGWQGGGGFRASVAREVQNDISLHGLKGAKALNYKSNLEDAVDAISKSGGKMLRSPTNPQEQLLAQRAYEIYDTAERFAKEGLHQLDLEGIPKKISSLTNADTASMKVIKTLFFPFQKTGMNLVQFVVDRTPYIGAKSQHFRSALAGELGDRARRGAQAQLVSGTLLYAGAGQLYLSGRLTGSIPREDRELAEAVGIAPYSVKIGNSWYQYTSTDPMGSFLGLTADFYQASERVQDEESLMAGVALMTVSLADLAADKTYMKGMSDMMSLMEDPEYRAEDFAASFASTLTPLSGTTRWTTRTIDPNLKETHTALDRWRSSLPNDLPTRTDAFGREISRSHLSAALGLRITSSIEEDDMFAVNEMRRLNAYPTDRASSFQGVPLTEEEHAESKRIMDQEFKPFDKVKELVGSTAYLNANDVAKKKAIKKLLDTTRQTSRQLLLKRNPEALKRFIEQKQVIFKNKTRLGTSPSGEGVTPYQTRRRVRRESTRRRALKIIDTL